MNIFFLGSGALSAATLIGHCTIGRTQFLQPTLAARELDPLVRKVLHAMFHICTVSFAAFAAVFVALGLGQLPGHEGGLGLVLGSLFGGYAAVYLIVSATSGIPGALGKMFQWLIFGAISALAVLGARM